MVDKIANPYKSAIKQHQTSAVAPAAELSKALDTIVAAMDAQAWVSPTADTFYTDLTGSRTTLGSVERQSMQEFQRAYDAEPDEIDPEDWRAHWSTLFRMRN